MSDAALPSIIDKTKPGIEWDDVIGLEAVKATLEDAVITPLNVPQPDGEGSQPKWRSILLCADAGCGKSYIARAVGGRVRHFLSVHGSDVLSRWLNDSPVKVLRDVFEEAIGDQPSVLLIDDLNDLWYRGNSTHNALKAEFSAQMEALAARKDRVIVLGASSSPWDLEEDILGRFEQVLYLPLPNQADRLALIKQNLGSVKTTFTDADLLTIAPRTAGLSAADVSIFVRDVLMQPVWKVQRATHYKKVPNPDYEEGSKVKAELMSVCDPGEDGAIEMDWTMVPADELQEPPITMADMQRCLQGVRPTVTEATLVRLQTFSVPIKGNS